MRTVTRILVLVLVALPSFAFAQTWDQVRAEQTAKQEESRKTLRAAMLQLRDVRVRSCSVAKQSDCELATLSDIEIALLDLETKNWRAPRQAPSKEAADKYSKIQATADETRYKVSELVELLK
jgi:hypothetical protein